MRIIERGSVRLAADVALASTILLCSSAGAEHFNIVLQVESRGDKATAMMDTTPPIGGVNPRPVLKTTPGAPVSVSWKMSSGFPHGTMKAVTVHFFVVRQQKLGQKPVPDPTGAAGIVDNSLTMDFGPKGVAGGALHFAAPPVGSYLIRIQSEDTHIEHDHEHFAAIDLSVQ